MEGVKGGKRREKNVVRREDCEARGADGLTPVLELINDVVERSA